MLTIFRRHLAKCPHRNKGRKHRRCSCPIHSEGNIGLNPTPVRKALNLTNWDDATVLVHKWEAQGYIDLDQKSSAAEAKKPEGKTIAEAAKAYLENCMARRISQPSIRKFEILLSAMEAHLGKLGITQIADVKPEHMDGFFNSWNWSPRTAQKQVERLRAVWRFVYRRRWVAFDPALDIKAPVVPAKEVDPLSEDEVEKILREASRRPRHYARSSPASYRTSYSGRSFPAQGSRLKRPHSALHREEQEARPFTASRQPCVCFGQT